MGNICCSDQRKHVELVPEIITLRTTIKNQYKTNRIIKVLHNNDTTVFLLENNVVYKKYNLETQRGKMENEIETYRRLKSLPFILKPLYVDSSGVYLPYIPNKPPRNFHNKKIVDTYLHILEKEYGISRVSEYQWGNLLQCPKTKQIYLTSFGNIPWVYTPPKTKWVISDNFSYMSRLPNSI